MNRKKKKALTKAQKAGIIGTAVFLAVGIIATVTGCVIKWGWIAVLKWFGSSMAIWIYVILALAIFAAVFAIHRMRMEKD